MTQTRLYLGIDGGGSGCRARLADDSFRVLGEGQAGPANLRLGPAAVWDAVHAAADAAIGAAGLSGCRADIHAAAGLAGTSRREALAALSVRPHAFASLIFVEDTLIACLGAHGGRDGGIVIAGTGSVGFGIVGDTHVRFGGYGFPISDEGSGADIGLEAMRRAMQAFDGRLPTTPLLADLLARAGGGAAEIIGWMDRAGATDYAALAACVAQHAANGDAGAGELLGGAASRVEALAEALFRAGVPRVCLMGGLAPVLEPRMSAQTRARLMPAEADALAGALILARRCGQAIQR